MMLTMRRNPGAARQIQTFDVLQGLGASDVDAVDDLDVAATAATRGS
jgi:hypothetical protein